jgi:hypothetical protein
MVSDIYRINLFLLVFFCYEGKFLEDLMTCLVPANHLNHPSEHFSILNITSAIKCSTLQLINKLYILHHYICLRARLFTFPPALSEDSVHGKCLIDLTIHIYF